MLSLLKSRGSLCQAKTAGLLRGRHAQTVVQAAAWGAPLTVHPPAHRPIFQGHSRALSSFHMLDVTSSSQEAVGLYDSAVHNYTSLAGDPAGELQRALELDNDFLLGHAALGFLYLLSTGVLPSHPVVSSCLYNVRRLLTDTTRRSKGLPGFHRREVLYSHAFIAWAQGRYRAAAAILEGSLAETPNDLLAVRTAHDIHFFNGDSVSIRNSVARVMQAWEPSMPGYGRLCGMLAFGLEECNQYEQAESFAMQAVNMDPTDAWAVHAAAHCYEMTSRLDEGRRFLQETQEHWEVKDMEEGTIASFTDPGSSSSSGKGKGASKQAKVKVGATLLEHHLNWHWALFDIGAGNLQHAITRYDNKMAARGPTGGAAVLNVIDDAALLWRIELARSHLLQPHGGDHASEGKSAGGGMGGASFAASTVDPSAAVGLNYLRFLDAIATSATGGEGGESANKEGPMWLPEGVTTPSRWTEVARHSSPYTCQHIAVFNDAQLAMALAAAGDEEGLSRHLATMEEYVEKASRAAGKTKPRHTLESVLASGKGQSPSQVAEALLSVEVPGIDGPHNTAGGGSVPLWNSKLHTAAFLANTSSSSSSAAHDASLPDNALVTAVVGLDLAHGMVHYWRSLEAQKSSQGVMRDMDRMTAAGSKGDSAAADGGQRDEGAGRGFFGFFGSREKKAPAAEPSPVQAAPEAKSAVPEKATPSIDELDRRRQELDTVAIREARSAFERLVKCRAHFGLLGGSLAQRDVFEQTLIHAAVAASGANTSAGASVQREVEMGAVIDRSYLQAAAAFASERVTLRFADPLSWHLYGSVLELMGEGARGADAKNRAYALGMGSKTA